jgi:hypothetical protein
VALWAYQRGWRVYRPNPRQVRDWARSQGRRAKTDRQAALVLARYGAERSLPGWQPLPEESSTWEAWLQRRADLAGLLQQERTRQQQMQARLGVPPGVLSSLERLIRHLEEALAQHDALRATCQRLRSVPGIGPKNVLPLFVLLSRWSGLTGGRGPVSGWRPMLAWTRSPMSVARGSIGGQRSRARATAPCGGRCIWACWVPCAAITPCGCSMSAW